MFNNKFPMSTPKCKIFNKEVRWNCLEDFKNFKQKKYCNGIVKCLILPSRFPQSVPAIPLHLKDDNRLLFPYCRSCCEQNKTGNVSDDMFDMICKHYDWEDRAWVATLPVPELELALEEV